MTIQPVGGFVSAGAAATGRLLKGIAPLEYEWAPLSADEIEDALGFVPGDGTDVTALQADVTALEDKVGSGVDTPVDGEFLKGGVAGASSWAALAAADVVSGTFAAARLASGTANANTYLRGDQTFQDAAFLSVFRAEHYGALTAASQPAAETNRATINAAIAAAVAAGGGIVQLPIGTYYLANSAGADAISITGSGVRLYGAGIGRTTLIIPDGANDHVINVVGNDCEIAYLTINGNRANNASGVHGIRMEGERHHVHDCLIEETVHYGIGLGQAVGTDLRHSLFENLYIRNTGGDGIDLKNRNGLNVGNRFSNIIIEDFDLAGNTAQAGLDIRGHATVNGLWVYCDPTPQGGACLRFRDDATTTGSATNCHFEGANAPVSVDVEIGASVGAATADVALSNIFASGFERDFGISGARCTLTNCHSLNAQDIGFYTRDNRGQTLVNCSAKGAVTGFNLEGDDARLIGCQSEDCTTNGVRVAGDRNLISHCLFEGTVGTGVLIVAGADATRILDSDFTQFSGTDVNDGGTNTAARTNPGLADIGNQVVFTRFTATTALNFASIAAQTCAELTMTVTGASAASLNVVALGVPTGIEAGLSWSARVSAANTVAIRLCNVTTGAIDPASATWRATVLQG